MKTKKKKEEIKLREQTEKYELWKSSDGLVWLDNRGNSRYGNG